MDMLEDIKVWAFIAATVVVKLLLSEVLVLKRAIATASAGILAALVMTEPTLAWFGLDGKTYQILVTCLWVIVGENAIRRLIDFSNKDSALAELWKLWRGQK